MNMSQQHMEYDGSPRERPGASYAAYEGVPHYNDYSTNTYGQKLTGRETSKIPTAAQRLALAIVSIVLWILLFLVIAGILGSYHPEFSVTPGGAYETGSNILEPFLIAGFAVFTVMVIVINVLFNRKR
jgi:hypothetical protein